MEFIDAARRRRTTRKFKADPVPTDVLNTILTVGSMAPAGRSCYNKMHLSVIQNKDLIGRISKAAAALRGLDTDPLYGVPCLVVVSIGTVEGLPPNYEYCNAACIAENMLLAATDVGLGSVYLTAPPAGLAASPALAEEAGIPVEYTAYAAVGLGYAAEDSDTMKPMENRIPTNYVD